MKSEIATLCASFFARCPRVPLANRWARSEGSKRTNRVFYDVLRHLTLRLVAKRRQSSIGAALFVVALLGGCAAGAGFGGLSADTPAEVKRSAVAARAQARWDALIKLNIEGAYGYLSPSTRATMPLDLYKAKHKLGLYRTVKVDGVNCEADACTVNLSVTYDYKRFKGVTTPVVEKWIITQGQAWFVDQG